MKNRNIVHPVTVFFVMWWIIAIMSWVGNIYSWGGVRSLFSAEALRWFLRYTEDGVMSSPVLYGVIILFIGMGLFVHSGLKAVVVRIIRRDRSLSGKERKSLMVSGFVAGVYSSIVAVLIWGPWNIVRGVTGRFDDSPLHDGALYVLSLGIAIVSIVYAFTADYYRSDRDVVKGMSYMFSKYASYIISLVFAIQFMLAFQYSCLYRIIGMTETELDIMYYICCILPVFSRKL